MSKKSNKTERRAPHHLANQNAGLLTPMPITGSAHLNDTRINLLDWFHSVSDLFGNYTCIQSTHSDQKQPLPEPIWPISCCMDQPDVPMSLSLRGWTRLRWNRPSLLRRSTPNTDSGLWQSFMPSALALAHQPTTCHNSWQTTSRFRDYLSYRWRWLRPWCMHDVKCWLVGLYARTPRHSGPCTPWCCNGLAGFEYVGRHC